MVESEGRIIAPASKFGGKESSGHPGRPRSARAHRAVLHAALELLREVGFRKMTIEGVASRAGVGRPTIYRHWGSLEELVAEALQGGAGEVPTPDTGSVWGDLDAWVIGGAREVTTPLGREVLALVVATAADNPSFKDIYWSRYVLPRRKALQRSLEKGQKRGEIRDDANLSLLMDLISGALLHRLLVDPREDTLEDYVRRTARELLRSFANERA